MVRPRLRTEQEDISPDSSSFLRSRKDSCGKPGFLAWRHVFELMGNTAGAPIPVQDGVPMAGSALQCRGGYRRSQLQAGGFRIAVAHGSGMLSSRDFLFETGTQGLYAAAQLVHVGGNE